MRKLLVLLVASVAASVACDKKTEQPAAPAPTAPAAPAAAAPATPPPAPAAPAAKAEWVEWVHPEKLISAKFPAAPKENKQEAQTAIGPVGMTMAIHAENTRAFMVGASQYKLPEGATFDTAKALQGARDQMLASIKATATGEKPIKLDGLDGTEVEFEAPGPGNGKVRGISRVFASDSPPAGYFAAAFRMTEGADPDAVPFLDTVHVGKGVAK